MKNLTEEKLNLIKTKGNLWEKEEKGISRTYISPALFDELFGAEQAEFPGAPKKLHKSQKMWVDNNDNSLHCDKGMVRTEVKSLGYECAA